jgi:TM2 domain-containing membrane protein YozV
MYTTIAPSVATEAENEVSVHPLCANCGTAIALHYCPNCGQRHAEGRLHMRHLFSEFVHNYLGTDSGFFFTIRQMLIRPGLAVNEFLAGKRKPYLKPVQFYLLMLTLYFILSEVLNVNPMDIGNQVNRDLGYSPSPEKMARKEYQQAIAAYSQNLKIIFSVLLFVLAFAMKTIYRKKPYTFTETLVFTLYTYGVSYLFSCLVTALLAANLSSTVNSWLLYGIYFLSLVYLVWAMHQFYGGRGVKSWLKASTTHLLSYAFFFLLAIIFGIVAAVMWKFTHKI